MLPWYATVEEFREALDYGPGVRSDRAVRRALEFGSRAVDDLCHRRFYPYADTRYFDWPDSQSTTSYKLWLDEDELISVSALVSGGVTIAATDYLLRSSVPYAWIELDRSTSASFETGDTSQDNIAVTGVFGYGNDLEATGALAEALDASETGVDVTDSANIGVGDAVLVGSEYMVVTNKNWASSTQVLQTALTASAANKSVVVTTGSAFHEGETVLLDTERMLITSVSGNTLGVERGWDGTALAVHTGSTVYVPRTLTVERGALGTTAATHDTASAVSKHRPPALVRSLALAEAINHRMQETSGLARTIGSGEGTRNASGAGLREIRDQVYYALGRVRVRSV